MRLRIVHGAPGISIPGPAIAAGIALLVLGLTAASILPATEGPVICPFRAVTGLPCPSCGLTRSAAALMRGSMGAAFATNPLDTVFLVVVAPIAAALWVLRRWKGIAVRVDMTRCERRVAWCMLVAAVLCNWGYVLATLR